MNIEKNIPLPERKKRPTKWDFLVNMEVGDSFSFPTKKASSTKSQISRAKGLLCPNFKLAFKEEDGAIRVWRKV
jgi:hypothetical protein